MSQQVPSVRREIVPSVRREMFIDAKRNVVPLSVRRAMSSVIRHQDSHGPPDGGRRLTSPRSINMALLTEGDG